MHPLLSRALPPEPWAEGDNLPWHDPAFSARMLREHLSQEHDLASRRREIIDRQIDWLVEKTLRGRAGRVLDLGCGPGFYLHRLAARGCTGRGIDWSPASIAYAREHSPPGCDYQLGDLRTTDFGGDWDLVMLLFGELNVFPPSQAAAILRRARASLAPGGSVVLEPQRADAVRSAAGPPTWSAHPAGLFGDSPHLLLIETFAHQEADAVTTRYWVVDLATASLERHAQTTQAYDEAAFAALLASCGLREVERWPSLTGEDDGGGLFVVIAESAEGA